MVQCAMYTMSSFPSQATTTSTGSCFIILCNTCAEQCSPFLCVHGREENSTSSIELDISDQGNSIGGESFLKNLSTGDSRVDSAAVLNCNCNKSSHYFQEINNTKYQKCLRNPHKYVQGANVSGNFFNESDGLSEKSKCSNNLICEKVCSDKINKCFYVQNKENECAVIGLTEQNLVSLKYLGLHETESTQRENQVALENDVALFSGYDFVEKPVGKLTADCGEENQCELGGVFEASNRLKRLEEHFKGIAYTKKLFKDVLGVVDRNKNCVKQAVTLEDLEKSCIQDVRKWITPPTSNLFKCVTPSIRCTENQCTINSLCPKPSHQATPNICTVQRLELDQNKGLTSKISPNFPSLGLGDSETIDESKNGSKCYKHKTECPIELIDTAGKYRLEENCILNVLPDLLNSTSEHYSKSVFDVRYLNKLDSTEHDLECYYEFDSSSCEEDFENSDRLNEAVYFHSQKSFESAMRELNGPLRGLLKKPNRPPQARKNRVVFDETRNEFFEADYIILIREDCAYDEEDEEPCTCGEHELIRLCCEEGCQCNYNDKNKTPQSPKYAPPLEFVDEAALSPPDGYKDNGLKNTISGALSGHVFGAQHIQQLQVIQRLQQQRAAMLAARASTQQQQGQQATAATNDDEQSTVCTECAECEECAAKQIQTTAHVDEDLSQLSVPAVAIIPLHNNSPERRVTQKEIIAGEERPKYILPNQHKSSQEEDTGKIVSVHKNQRYVVETITMTTVTERRIVREATEDVTTVTPASAGLAEPLDQNNDVKQLQRRADTIPAQISGILKGGKLWKQEQSQVEDINNTSSEDDSNLKRSVRFMPEANRDISREGDGKAETECSESENPKNEIVPFKKHSSLFNNALRPNSAMRQLFPSSTHPPPPAAVLTHEALRAFEESKRGNPLMSSLLTSNSESDTMRRTIERNSLRRSLINRKKTTKSDISLEERIKQLTCDIEESTTDISFDNSEDNEKGSDVPNLDRRDSPTGEENPSQEKYIPDKSFSPSSSASSSSSGSTSAYKKISNVFNREKRHDKIPEIDENPIVIIPQECRCPAAPDLGMGVQVPAAHTQIHQTPPRQTEPRKQFLSTLAPLTACVAGQKDDFSYYTLANAERNANASTQCSEYNMGDLESTLLNNDSRKVAPDVIAGTPGQEQDELAAFVNQEANRTEKIKKRYSNESSLVTPSNVSSDDDEQNDYGFNKRPSVRGIKPKFSSTNEILQQMQAQLSQPIAPQSSGKSYSTSKQPPSTNNKVQHNIQHASLSQHQSERSWSFYADADQRLSGEQVNQHTNYYQAMPTAIKQAFHGHEESLTYQNCHSVTMEQHYGRFTRSPTRRPESPPPLRNYHQTMVLIPYTESHAQFTSQDPKSGQQQFSRHNILEYQQVTQQTIRVPISYTLPGMQLHVVTGRGTQPQYLHNPRVVASRPYTFQQDNNSIAYCERGVPEGAATTTHTDSKNLLSPSAIQGNQQNCTQTSNGQSSIPETVFYAMNV